KRRRMPRPSSNSTKVKAERCWMNDEGTRPKMGALDSFRFLPSWVVIGSGMINERTDWQKCIFRRVAYNSFDYGHRSTFGRKDRDHRFGTPGVDVRDLARPRQPQSARLRRRDYRGYPASGNAAAGAVESHD